MNPAGAILAGVRVLVVEDNFLVANVIAQHLRSRGAEVVGPASTAARALELVESGGFDAAVLDIDLQGGTVEPVARRLRTLARPFVFLTGYNGDDGLPPEFAGSARLAKPVRMEDLDASVLALAGRAAKAAGPG